MPTEEKESYLRAYSGADFVSAFKDQTVFSRVLEQHLERIEKANKKALLRPIKDLTELEKWARGGHYGEEHLVVLNPEWVEKPLGRVDTTRVRTEQWTADRLVNELFPEDWKVSGRPEVTVSLGATEPAELLIDSQLVVDPTERGGTIPKLKFSRDGKLKPGFGLWVIEEAGNSPSQEALEPVGKDDLPIWLQEPKNP